MYGSELRACGLGAIVAVLLGAGAGFGWHFFADRVTGRAVAAAATPLAQQDASNPPLACPPPPREGPVRDVPLLPALSRPNNQPDTTHARSGLRFAHSARAGRARQVPRSDGADGG
jgi:hypothetical protein